MKKRVSNKPSHGLRNAMLSAVVSTAVMANGAVFASVGKVAAVAAVAAVAIPTTAHAQKNKRICGNLYRTGFGKVALVMEVNKADLITCSGWVAAISGITSARDFARKFLNASTAAALKKENTFYLKTCEGATSAVFPGGAYGGDACNSMQDYKIYGWANINRGSRTVKKLN